VTLLEQIGDAAIQRLSDVGALSLQF